MGCGHGYQGHGCWGPGDRWGWQGGWEPGSGYGYGPGYGWGPGHGYGRSVAYGRPFAGRPRAASQEAAAMELEAYLTSLKDEVRAIEADLAELRVSGEPEAGGDPQV